MSFTQKVLEKTGAGVVYLVPEDGDGEIDYFHLLLVPHSACRAFEKDIAQCRITLADYGRVLHYGSGAPTKARIAEILREHGIGMQDAR